MTALGHERPFDRVCFAPLGDIGTAYSNHLVGAGIEAGRQCVFR